MEEDFTKMNIYQKLSMVRKMAGAAKRDKKGFGYTYAKEDGILAKVTAGMNKYGLSLIPQIVSGTVTVDQIVTTNTKTDTQGNSYDKVATDMLVKGQMIFRWVNDDNPSEFIEVPWVIIGMQSDPSQAFGSGLTYCRRYFLLNYFQMAQTDDDVDTYRSKQKAAEKAEDDAVAKALVEQINSEVTNFLSGKDDTVKKKVKAFIGSYVKDADYKKITDPKLAGKLLREFKDKFSAETKEDK